ncbi:MAG: DNA polymerase IV [Bacteroidales bacterium]|jgi:DNA polymerase-4|nr:DNA polymerase IV [Bacteroidales bacterium]
MDRSIVHIDLDTFFVSVERLLDSRLNNKPVLVGGTNGRGVVAACSYEARRYGIHSAMPMGMAQKLCPEAIVIRGDGGMYSKFSNMVTDIINEDSPLYEKSSIDEFYIDVSGMDRFFGTYKWACELREKIIKETGLPISFGLSTNKTVAKVGTSEAKPNNHINIPKGFEKGFLAPLAVKKIPMVGDKSYKMLLSMGVKYVKTVQEIPIELMESIMGKNGIVLWKKAQGIDNTPVEPYNERKSISSSITLEKDTIDTRQLKNILTAMTEKLAFQLRNEQKLTSVVTVTIRYSDFDTRTRQHRIPYTSLDHTLIKTVMSLFDQLYDRRLLVRLVGVRFSSLISGNYQMNLFEDTSEMINLYQAMDSIRNRYGNTAIRRVSTLGSRIRNGGSPFQGNLSA